MYKIGHLELENRLFPASLAGMLRLNEWYYGPVHREFIRMIKENVGIPVVGNGDRHSAFDAKAMLERIGCDFVMIGTSAIINPLIFYETDKLLQTGTIPETSHVVAFGKFLR